MIVFMADISDDDDQEVNVKDNVPSSNDTDPFPCEIPITFTTKNGVEVNLLLKR